MTGVLGRLAAVVAGGRVPGAYAFHSDALPGTLAAALRAGGLAAHVLDTTGATDKRELLARCARDLALPAWFGHNWDALVDALRDVDGEHGTVVLWVGARTLPDELAAIALDVLRARTAAPPPLTLVVLDAPAAFDLPPL